MKKLFHNLFASLGLTTHQVAKHHGFNRSTIAQDSFPGKIKPMIIEMATEYAKIEPEKAKQILMRKDG
jgi:hypothetical protein